MITHENPFVCRLSICIITYRRPCLLEQCLNSLRLALELLDEVPYEVIVSDDCPSQSALDVVNNSCLASWVAGPGRGVAANRNNVVSVAKGEWIIFIDDDEIADREWISRIYEAILTDSWDVIEGRVQPVDFPDSILWYAPCIFSGGNYCTANLAIKKTFFLSLGGFNEDFAVSHEDVEFGRRIREASTRSLYLDLAIVFHPARFMPFQTVFSRMISLQCQSYLYQAEPPLDLSFTKLAYLVSFLLKYWFRVLRFELYARTKGQWRRQLQAAILLLITTPIAGVKILSMHFSPRAS